MVDILLATFNGELFIEEQIQSILKQTFNDWILIVRDDGSSDRTREIIFRYSLKYPDKIINIQDGLPSGSAKNNFLSLLKHSKNKYVMFCDQDDIWLPNKIELCLKAMQTEEQHYPSSPILIHSDLTVVNENGAIICASLYEMQNIKMSYFNRIERLLVQNAITGCTMMINRALADMLSTIPNDAIMHDWWIALHAIIFGKIVYLKDSQILYRQHVSNTVGAKDTRSIAYITHQLRNIKGMKDNINQTYLQARALYECLVTTDINPALLDVIDRYAKLSNKNKIIKILTIVRYGYLKNSLVRRLGQLILC